MPESRIIADEVYCGKGVEGFSGYCGPVRRWYENGQLEVEAAMPTGAVHSYYPSGIKKGIGHYKNFHWTGTWRTWHENGVVFSEGNYDKGRRTGDMDFSL
ncbi:MAG: hypothetical protein M5R36_15765 [Deltaproteobacteria bacterium]|nr:hypothetical protein [Deltaproteobacteria bacterium]